MKLFKNWYLLGSYLLLLSLILFARVLGLYDSVDAEIMDHVYLWPLLLYLIWSMLFSVKLSSEGRKTKLLALVVVLFPGIFDFILFLAEGLLFSHNMHRHISQEVPLYMVLGILFTIISFAFLHKLNFYLYAFGTLFLGLFFKQAHFPFANEFIILFPIFIFIKAIYEIVFAIRSSLASYEYKKLIAIQSIGFLSFSVGLLFILIGIDDVLIGKILIYLFFLTTLVFLLLLPKSDYVNWDKNIKKRFHINFVLISVFLLSISILLVMSDTIGFDVFNMISESYFKDYTIDFSKPLN